MNNNVCKKCNKIIGHPDSKCTEDKCDIIDWCPCCDNIMKLIRLTNSTLFDPRYYHIAYKRPHNKSKTDREICYYLNGDPYDVKCNNHYDKSNFIYCKKCKKPLTQFIDYSTCTENHCEEDDYEPCAMIINKDNLNNHDCNEHLCMCGCCMLCGGCECNDDVGYGLFD